MTPLCTPLSTSTITSQTDMSSSPMEKSGVRLTFGFFDSELPSMPSSPRSDSLPTPPLSPAAPTSDPIFVSTSLPMMHQPSDLTVMDSAPITPTEASVVTQPQLSAPIHSPTTLFFSPTSSGLKRSATTKTLARPSTPQPMLMPNNPLRGRSSSLNGAITFTGSLDHRSMTRVRSTSSRSPSIRSTRPRAPQTISPSQLNETSTSSVPQDTIPVPLPNTKSGRDSVVAFLSSAPVRSRVLALPPRSDESVDVTTGTTTLRPSPSSSSLTLQSRRCLMSSNSLRIAAGHRVMKRRPTSFIENFDSTRNYDEEENDTQKKKEMEFDAFSHTSVEEEDDNDFNDYPYDSHVHDKTHSATTATTATTTTKKAKKLKMWCPNLSMFSFMMKSRKKL